MMKWVFGIMIILSIFFGIVTNRIGDVSNSAIESGEKAIQLILVLIGSMAVWGGIMRIADKAGITNVLSRAFKPLAKLLFKGIDLNGKAFKAICMNVTANLLGLGNAATPLGIEAMRQLEIEEKTTHTASRNMIMFAVLNTASIQLLPTTIAALRLKHGSKTPLDVLPAILISSLISVIIGITMVFLFDSTFKGGGKNKFK